MIKVFIGYDPAETVAFWVLSHSIMRRSSQPVAIIPLNLRYLPLTRERHPKQSTEFSFSRFLAPALTGFSNEPCVFLDCDMLCLGDIAELVSARDNYYAPVSCVQHSHEPKAEVKMRGAVQTKYEKKNWSSVMVFYPSHFDCRRLTVDCVNTASGLDLHQFRWVKSGAIGTLPSRWNHLVGYDQEYPISTISLLHWTEGGPWWKEFQGVAYAEAWYAEREDMLSSGYIGSHYAD